MGGLWYLVKHIWWYFRFIYTFSEGGKRKGFTSLFILVALWYFLCTPTRGHDIYFISTLMIALDMVMFILFQNTSRNVLLCWSHVILKWKISWLNNIIVLTTDWWGKYTSGIYHLYVKSMELFTIVIYRTLHKWMEELTVLYTPLFLWK